MARGSGGVIAELTAKHTAREKLVAEGFYYKPLPIGSYVELTFASGTPINTSGTRVISLDDGYDHFHFTWFRLTTPPEAKAKIIISDTSNPVDSYEEGNIIYEQDPNKPDELIDCSEFDPKHGYLVCDKVWLYGETTANTTADRQIILKYAGREVVRKI